MKVLVAEKIAASGIEMLKKDFDVEVNTELDPEALVAEIAKYDGDLGAPNVYVSLDPEDADRKVDNLLSAFASQTEKYWFTADNFRALMRVRGIECRASSGFAEAFYAHKMVFGASSST